MSKSGLKVPSTKTKEGLTGKLSIALFIANKEALRILILSILLLETTP